MSTNLEPAGMADAAKPASGYASNNKHESQLTTLLIAYVDAGFSLVPIPVGAKGPTTSGWNQRDRTITSREAAHRLQIGNVGLAHAYCSPSPTAALDLDDLHTAKTWLAARSINLLALLEAPNATLIDSGRANRAKLLYRLPAAMGPLPSIKHNDEVSGATVFELRCATKNGKTVQDVLPPSIHPMTGAPYRWTGNGHFTNLPVMPDPLLELWASLLSTRGRTPRPRRSPTAPKAQPLDGTTRALLGEPETPRRIATVREMLAHVNADCDYATYRDVVWAVAATGWSCGLDLLRAWSLTAPHRYEEHTLITLLANYSYAGGIHYGTLVHHARQGGWHD